MPIARDDVLDAAAPALGGEINAAVARAIVGVYRDVAGRGPTRARAFFRDNVLVVLLEQVLTKAELSLAGAGQHQSLRMSRDALQVAMEPGLIAAVEQLTGTKVVALLSSNQVKDDMAAQIFLLDRRVACSGAV